MANIFSRLRDIISSNVHAQLDKMEDPGKLVDEYIRQASRDLAEVKANTGAVMAQAEMAKKNYDANEAEIERMTKAAQTAANKAKSLPEDSSEREDVMNDARKILARKAELTEIGASLKETKDVAEQQADLMITAHNKLVDDINKLKMRRDSIKSKIAVAKTQETVNKFAGKTTSGALTKFADIEQKADMRLAKSRAISELNDMSADPAVDIAASYLIGTQSVEDELAALMED